MRNLTDETPRTCDRRRARSDAPHDAIRLFLEAAVDRNQLDALCLVDDDGALVAGVARASCRELDLASVGTVGSLCAPGRERGPSLRALVERVTAGRDLDARPLAVRGERLCIAAVGGPLPEGSLIVAGVERILGEVLPAVI